MRHIALILLALTLAPCLAHAWPARVVQVTDGDTIIAEPAEGGNRVRVRLYGIDAPELRQPYGGAAKDFVVAMVLFQAVDVREVSQGRDRYGRVVAIVVAGGKSVQEELLREGLAWVWTRYCRSCDEWEALQADARRAGRGLWAAPVPAPPWEWRKRRN